ncbi:MAG: phosphotransferase [Chlorobiaceae bacterium]|nr:phosphotransferase [Chlorobiaceae bacterium]
MNIPESITGFFSPEIRTHLTIDKIQGDASTRQYFRVNGPDGSSIACYDPALASAGEKGYPFIVMQELFAEHGIPVPEIRAVDAEKGLLLLEDCGDLLLQNIFSTPLQGEVPALYRKIVDIMTTLQSIRGVNDRIPFSLGFDRDKLMFEFDFFIEHALRGYFSPLFEEPSIAKLRGEFEAITEALVLPGHFVLNHRDFHSRNILLMEGKPVIIDFQDARMGLPQYDAVSLVRDSYVRLENTLQEELKLYHHNALCERDLTSMGFDEYLHYFDLMAFQRNIKAVGTFCYQTRVRKNNTFERSIAPTIAYLPDYISARSELRKAGEMLKPVIERYRS